MTERHTKKPGFSAQLPTVYTDGLEELGSLPCIDGVYVLGPPEHVDGIQVRSELKVLSESEALSEATVHSIGKKEWDRHGNCAVYVPNMGPIDHSWTLAEGGTVLVRAQSGGWYMIDLKKDEKGWFATCLETRVPIVWDDARQVWVSTVPV